MSESNTIPRQVVMTGGTAGLGAHALRRIEGENTRVILGCRRPESTNEVMLDLASLKSVRAFVRDTLRILDGAPIDILVLNAGVSFPSGPERSDDGFEATFGVNHLAHYLILRLLLPHLARDSTVVITTSDVHAQAPDVLDLEAWSRDAPGGSGMAAYAASKLCNLLTARALAIQEQVLLKNCLIIAYNPGLTRGTRLARSAPWWQQSMMNSRVLHCVLRLGSNFVPMMYPGTPERAGEALADLALGNVVPPEGRVYASLVRAELTFPDPSELGSDDSARDAVWRLSAEMVGRLED